MTVEFSCGDDEEGGAERTFPRAGDIPTNAGAMERLTEVRRWR